MDLRFNTTSPFTRWVVKSALLEEPFVLIDVGVQGGESVRWHLLGDYLIVNGFDAIKEVIEELTDQNRGNLSRHYHWLAIGAADEEQQFYFNSADPFSSSLYQQGEDRFALLEQRRDELRTVSVRRLDTLFAEGVIPRADFIKCDVEGYEKEVFAGGRQLLKSALGVECESNFGISPFYRNSHFGTIQNLLLEANLLAIDLNFNRVPRASFVQAVSRKGGDPAAMKDLGKPATLNVLFCRDPVAEADQPESYATTSPPLTVDQLLKTMIIYENHGLPDIAVDIAERFAERLSSRIDVDKAIDLLADLSQEQYESMVPEIQGLKNWVSAYKGQIDGLQHEIATTNFRFSQVLAEIVELRDQAKEYKARIDDLQHELATAESRLAQVCKTPPLDNVSASTLVTELRFRVRRRLDRMLRAPTG